MKLDCANPISALRGLKHVPGATDKQETPPKAGLPARRNNIFCA